MGLSICLAILREHNGQIEAAAPADGGPLFTVSLPIARGTAMFLAEPSDQSAAPPLGEVPKEAAAAYSILVVDDEESIREMIREGLSARGFQVQTAATVEEAVSLMERLTFDAVLCDLNFRSGGGAAGSGLDVYAALTGAAPDPKDQPLFFVMSGELVAPALAEQLSQAGARMLQKPFRISDLIAILSEALAKRVRGRSQLSHVR